MATTPIIINWDIAEKVFGKLIQLLRAGAPPYDKAQLPHIKENLPKNIKTDTELACFLFCSCYYMRGGINSLQAILTLSPIYQKYPLIFRPDYFRREKFEGHQAAIRKLFVGTSLNYGAEATAGFWVKNFRKLDYFWHGNPLMLFDGLDGDYSLLYHRIVNQGKFNPDKPNGFLGFQEKMASMLSYFLVDTGLVKPLMIPVPVDFHVMRMMVEHNIIQIDQADYGKNIWRNGFISALREVSLVYCERHKIEPVELCNALWLYSRSCCKDSPGNVGYMDEYRGRQTAINYPAGASWRTDKTQRYYNVCGSCPVKTTCIHDVPSAHYYKRHELICKPKEKPIQTNLFY
ncbi:MAG: hypothetical protein WCO55_05665 [Candidatus Falkowbacteria bacterium]